MTTREEYAEAAEYFTEQAEAWKRHSTRHGSKYELAARVLRQLAEGKVLAPLDDLKRLVFAARTTGGTSGRDDELCDACAAIEPLLIAAATQGETDATSS